MTIVFSLLLTLIPTIQTESGRFTIYQDGKLIGTEQFTISAIPGGYRAEGQTLLAGAAAPIKSRLELDDRLNPLSYEYTDARGRIRLKIEKPVSEFEIEGSDGQISSNNFRFPDNGFIVDSNFMHHFLLLLYKAGNAGGSYSLYVPQDKSAGSAVVRSTGNRTFEIQTDNFRAEATTGADGRMLRLSVPDAKVVVER